MEERLATIKGSLVSAGNNGANAGTDVVEFVGMPADEPSILFQELLLNLTSHESGGDPFLTLLAPYFRLQPGETVDPDLIEKDAAAAREAGCATGMCPHVSPMTLQRAAEEGTVERIKLSEADSDDDDSSTLTTTTRIYMYYDDSAHLKKRPMNQRATEFSRDKNDGATIYGDIFLAKMLVKKTELHPMSLSMAALQKEPWIVDNSHPP